jgi:putative hemolysin
MNHASAFLAAALWAASAAAQSVTPGAEIGAPNPAAQFCEQEGGRYRTVEEAGGARGICVLPDGREVDAWAYFREQHGAAPGGAQLPNTAAVFCVEQGGDYRIEPGDCGMRSVCVLPNGREVDAWAYFREQHGALPPSREAAKQARLQRPPSRGQFGPEAPGPTGS